MRFLTIEALERDNVLIHRDYTYDYRGSVVPASLELLRPPRADVVSAFERIRQRVAVSSDTLREIFTNVVDGKHILLYGPPGTGKTTLAGMIASELFGAEAVFETAVADWTPFETIGGLYLISEDGMEQLRPQAGVITSAIVACLNTIAERQFVGTGPQGVWLVLDELNRANMDAAFGQFFTALDQEHRQVSLPFFDEYRRHITVPKRFRIIGTMNTYDKNFLFRMSYALTRRFALIPLGVPANSDSAAREEERRHLWMNLQVALRERDVVERTVEELKQAYDDAFMQPLYDELVPAIRAQNSEGRAEGLGRGIGFAQIAAALRHAVFEVELGLVPNDETASALDRGVRAFIVPQLEGLSTTALTAFYDWWKVHPMLQELPLSLEALRELFRGSELFLTD